MKIKERMLHEVLNEKLRSEKESAIKRIDDYLKNSYGKLEEFEQAKRLKQKLIQMSPHSYGEIDEDSEDYILLTTL